MKWWPLYGLKRHLTEQREYISPITVQQTHKPYFNRSLFVYVIDVGSCNNINFEISALESPQYNIHRFGIYMTDSPRHADVLLILGKPTRQMSGPLEHTMAQLPLPFYTIVIDDNPAEYNLDDYPDLPNCAAYIQGIPDAGQILGTLLDLSKIKRKRL
jgi:hypothetical protein